MVLIFLLKIKAFFLYRNLGAGVDMILMKITLDDKTIEYQVIRKSVKNITLRIKAKGLISITVNQRISQKQIEQFLISKKDWILSTLDKLSNRILLSSEPTLVKHMDKIYLLGNPKTIKIIPSTMDKIILLDNEISISTVKVDEEYIRKLWEKWFNNYVKTNYTAILLKTMDSFQGLNMELPTLKIRKMKSRWGSCLSDKRIITINTLLIHTPIECIEYVIAHELTHFLHPDHSRRFYNALTIAMPDYKERNEILKQYVLI